MIWPSCTWREKAHLVIKEAALPSSHSHPCPGLAHLDVMALWNHNILLGEQVLDSVLGDDVLYLEKGGEEAGVGALLEQKAQAGVQDITLSMMAAAQTLGGVAGKVLFPHRGGLGKGGGPSRLRCSPGCQRSPGAVLSGHQLW